MSKCVFCNFIPRNTTALRKHYRQIHPGKKPYTCRRCHLSFSHKSSMRRHVKCCSVVSKKLKNIPIENNVPKESDVKNVKIFVVARDYQILKLEKCDSMEKWFDVYREITKNSMDTPISLSVQTQVSNYIKMILKDNPKLFSCLYYCPVFEEMLDELIDNQLTQVRLSTITQRLRYLRWFVCFSISTKKCDLEILECLDNTISELQPHATTQTVNLSLTCILDPYRLLHISNKIISILRREQQTVIDPFIKKYFSTRNLNKRDLVKFGVDHLRYFIELSMRFCNVPCRVQCTTNLMCEKYSECDFVAKLVIGPNQISRLINNDKTGDKCQMVSIPLDTITSGYLLFYYLFCRQDLTSNYVFQGISGGKWKNASRDLKTYLTEKDINCAEICPNGRLIHGTRHIGLAVFSIASGFDIAKIRNYATLMRHQLVHVEKIYTPWIKLEQSKAAVNDFFSNRYINKPVKNIKEKAHIKENTFIDVISDCDNVVRSCLNKLMIDNFKGIHLNIVYMTRTVSTQTCGPDIEHVRTDITEGKISEGDSELPNCKTCKNTLSVFGPVGLTRSPHFGQYYRQCKDCEGNQPYKNTEWYCLGVIPNRKSNSNKPRNLIKIEQFVLEKTGLNVAGIYWKMS